MCRGRRATTPTYTTGKESPAREPSWSAFWLKKPSILLICVGDEDAGGRDLRCQPLGDGRVTVRFMRLVNWTC